VSTLVLREVRALDASGSFTDAVDVAVADGIVTAVRPVARSMPAPPGARQVDAAGLWLMPGVFDCHVHVGMSTTDTLENLRTPSSLRTLATARNLRATLAAGVTHVRDAGGVDAGVRAALERGLVDGPQLQVAIVMLSQTGGHVDGFLPGLPAAGLAVEDFLPTAPGRPPFLVDGVDAMRRTVRETLRAGADWIKVCTSGGVFGGAEAAEGPQLTVEEVAVAVQEAARRRRGVMAHAVSHAGIEVALDAGVQSIEHGVGLDERQARRMADTQTFLVPTLVIYRKVIDMVAARPDVFPATVRDAARSVERRLGACVALAHEHSVPVALGSDFADAADHGANLAEIAHLHRAGLPVEAALLAATAGGARLCGVGDRQGAIACGHRFDALLLDEDPGDLSCFLRRDVVTGVFRAGAPVVPHPRLRDGTTA
jgi:imidazolonepropionase-like amidohydrolase